MPLPIREPSDSWTFSSRRPCSAIARWICPNRGSFESARSRLSFPGLLIRIESLLIKISADDRGSLLSSHEPDTGIAIGIKPQNCSSDLPINTASKDRRRDLSTPESSSETGLRDCRFRSSNRLSRLCGNDLRRKKYIARFL